MNLWNDVRYGARLLAKSPAFTLLAVIVLALGIGAASAMFALVNTLLLRPLSVEEPERIVGFYSKDREKPNSYRSFSYPNYFQICHVGKRRALAQTENYLIISCLVFADHSEPKGNRCKFPLMRPMLKLP